MSLIDEARALQEQIVAWRRDIHRHPELGFRETRTAGMVAEELQRLGLAVRQGVGGTGVLGDLETPGARGRMLLRADMDALPVQEETGDAFASQVPGVAHLCGHDAHTAMLLGAAHLLARHRGELSASVRLMFQPCEESCPSGAPAMLADGALDGVDAALAIHVWLDEQAGVWGVRSGTVLASVDRVTITVHGRGGHAAMPERCADPVVAAAQAVMALQTVMSRRISPRSAGVLSLCSIHGGEAYNVIPERVAIVGTVRAHSESVRAEIKRLCGEICEGVARAAGVHIEAAFDGDYPVTVNEAGQTAKVRAAIQELFGPAAIKEHEKKFGGEDFSYVLQRVPGCMVFLGAANEAKGAAYPLHSPRFRIDEDVLWQGSALLAHVALGHHRSRFAGVSVIDGRR